MASTMPNGDLAERPDLQTLVRDVMALASEDTGIELTKLSPASRLVKDLGLDSMALVMFIMQIEDRFSVSLPAPDDAPDQAYKELFTRPDFSLADMVESIHLRWGIAPTDGVRQRSGHRAAPAAFQMTPARSFTQLGGVLVSLPSPLYRPIGVSPAGNWQYRRMTDGMVCIQVPAATVEIGSRDADAGADERPLHSVKMQAFLCDTETVSTTAYCRFLNSIGSLDAATLAAWFSLDPAEYRFAQQVIVSRGSGWQPARGATEWPMVLVSWYGANAYAHWAHGLDWRTWREACPHLPTEAQWEYAARGALAARWPWGEAPPEPGTLNVDRRGPGTPDANELPLAPVHADAGMSPFGLSHMAGNVWQWCRDWYAADAYAHAADGLPPATETGARSERGGSWVGPEALARSSYRRGRAPSARGRCLGFRCVAPVPV